MLLFLAARPAVLGVYLQEDGEYSYITCLSYTETTKTQGVALLSTQEGMLLGNARDENWNCYVYL
jgi:hypothetical protein